MITIVNASDSFVQLICQNMCGEAEKQMQYTNFSSTFYSFIRFNIHFTQVFVIKPPLY